MSYTTFIPPLIEQKDIAEAPLRKLAPAMLVLIGNSVLASSIVGLIITVVIAYTHHEFFSMTTQVVAHISMILFAGTLKLGYVVRLNGLHTSKTNKSGQQS